MTIKEQVTEIWNSYKDTEKPSAAEVHRILVSKNKKNYSSSNIRSIVRDLRIPEDSYLEAVCEQKHIPASTVKRYTLKTDDSTLYVEPGAETFSIEDMEAMFLESIKKINPKYPNRNVKKLTPANLLVIDPADIHFGKLASAYQTGEDYNINVAKQRLIEGVDGILYKASNFDIDKVLLVIGNDILHYDTPKKTTTSGTPQDSDVMFFDMFNVAFETMVEIISTVGNQYETHIIFNPSNHDYQSGFMLARALEAWFKNESHITFDTSISHRKYYQWGKNLIGTSHGDGAKMQDMPLLMANEVPQMWANTKYRHIYLHHIHHKQVNKFQSGKDFIGATVEYLRSPSNADSWHDINGYTGAKKAIEGFIHNFEDGQIARISHYF